MTTEQSDFVAKLTTMAKENLEKDGELMPVLILHGEQVKIIGLQFGSTEEKRMAYQAMERLIAEDKPDYLVTLNDSWMAIVEPGDMAAVGQAEQHGVRSLPNYKDALVVMLSERDGPDTMWIHPYHKDGDTIVWEESKGPESTTVKNRLLPPIWKRRPRPTSVGAN